MLIKRKFLIFLLLCIPFCAMAEDATPDATALAKNISDSKTVDDAIKEYLNSFKELESYYNNKADANTIAGKKKEMEDKINSIKTNETTAAKATAQETEQNSGDGLSEAEKKYQEAHDKEQSKANRTLTALTTAATGIGGMELAMGLSEQKADKDADADMAAYIATMRCTYADGQQVKAGPEEIELPGGNNSELMKLRNEYFALANDLKERKTALGMKPGIESEEILDKAQTGLYDDESLNIDAGAYASLYRAQMLGSEADQAKIDEERKASKNRVIAGGVLVGAGAVGGMIGDSLINGKLGEKIKELKNKKSSTKENNKIIDNLVSGLGQRGFTNLDGFKEKLSGFDLTGEKDWMENIDYTKLSPEGNKTDINNYLNAGNLTSLQSSFNTFFGK